MPGLVATVTLEHEAEATRELVRRYGLPEFCRQFWKEAGESKACVWNWHLDAICAFLMAVSVGQIRDGVITVPPGMGKSLFCNVFWPIWDWTIDGHADFRWLHTSYDAGLVHRDAQKAIRLIQSPRFRAAFPGLDLLPGSQAVSSIETAAHGRRLSVQLGSGITGWHFDRAVIDDPLKPSAAESPTGAILDAANQTIQNTLSTRRRDPQTFGRLMIMQRLADNDPAGLALAEGAEHLCLPMRYVPRCQWDLGCSLGRLDPRTEPGELLFPERFPEAEVVAIERGLGSPQRVSAQLQQNPVPASGSFFEDSWLKTWIELPEAWRLRWVQSWDLGFKGKAGRKVQDANSRVSGTLWAVTPTDCYLVDERIGWWNYPDTKREFLAAQGLQDWARAGVILIEDKANGPALMAEIEAMQALCQHKIRAIQPKGEKTDRVRRHTDFISLGHLWLPTPDRLASVGEFRAELVRFPRQKLNDRVDTTTQMLDYVRATESKMAEELAGIYE